MLALCFEICKCKRLIICLRTFTYLTKGFCLISIFSKFFEDICREKSIISKYKKSSYHWTLHWAWRGPALQGPDVQPRVRRTARNQQPWDMLSEDASAEDSSSRDRVVWGRVWRTALTWESWAFLKKKHPQFNYLQREREAAATGPLGMGLHQPPGPQQQGWQARFWISVSGVRMRMVWWLEQKNLNLPNRVVLVALSWPSL